MSLLAYARCYGLALDHLTNDLDAEVNSIQPVSPNESNLVNALDQDSIRLGCERLSTNREAVTLLADTIAAPSQSLDDPYQQYTALKRLRLEPPLLSRSPLQTEWPLRESDAAITSSLHRESELHLVANSEPDWSPAEKTLASKWTAVTESEKIDATHEALQLVQDCMQDSYTSQIHSEAFQHGSHATRLRPTRGHEKRLSLPQNGFAKLLSPPLLPLDDYEPIELSSSLLNLEQAPDLAEADDRLRANLKITSLEGNRLYTERIPQDFQQRVQEPIGHLKPCEGSFSSRSLCPTTQPKSLHELSTPKIESPLTPSSAPESITKNGKRVSFELDSDKRMEAHSTSDDDRNLLQDALNDEHVVEVASPSLARSENKVNWETFDRADVLRRVHVPKLVGVLPRPPWKLDRSGQQRNIPAPLCLDKQLKKHDLKNGVQVSLKLEGDLIWAPFPQAAKQIELEEFPQGTKNVQDMLMDLGPDLRSDDMLWKPAGLQILKTDEEDDEPLSRSRRWLFEQRSGQNEYFVDDCSTVNDSSGQVVARPSSTIPMKRSLHSTSCADVDKRRRSCSQKQSHTSTIRSLSTFMRSRGFCDTSDKPFSTTDEPDTRRSPEISGVAGFSDDIIVPATQPEAPNPDLCQPMLFKNLQYGPIIVNTALLKTHKSLLGRLEECCETVIFRDFTLKEGNPELILSPVTCVIITTLQAAQQRSLPGMRTELIQSGPLHGQLSQLSNIYQQIFVLAVNPVDDNANLDSQSCTALASLSAFAAGQRRKCRSRLIIIQPMSSISSFADQEEQHVLDLHHHLLNWILTLIERHGHTNSHDEKRIRKFERLLQEETQWECWLRRVGLHPFAAQVAIGTLKDVNYRGVTGLRALLRMSNEERLTLLSKTLGVRATALLNASVNCQWK